MATKNNYANAAWEVLRDFHKCDQQNRNDFDFETIHVCENYYVVLMSQNHKVRFKFYFDNGFERLFEYDPSGTLKAAYMYDQQTNTLVLTDNNGNRL